MKTTPTNFVPKLISNFLAAECATPQLAKMTEEVFNKIAMHATARRYRLQTIGGVNMPQLSKAVASFMGKKVGPSILSLSLSQRDEKDDALKSVRNVIGPTLLQDDLLGKGDTLSAILADEPRLRPIDEHWGTINDAFRKTDRNDRYDRLQLEPVLREILWKQLIGRFEIKLAKMMWSNYWRILTCLMGLAAEGNVESFYRVYPLASQLWLTLPIGKVTVRIPTPDPGVEKEVPAMAFLFR